MNNLQRKLSKIMNLLYLFLLSWTMQAVFGQISTPRRDLKFLDLAKYDGYKAEQHFVTTEDGYILGLHRVPPKEHCTENKGVIMFVHGLYLSSDDCLVPGPGVAHCYIYSDNCYDVWAPNVRGNVYSRNHTSLDPDKDSKFWDFSVDELAKYDLPVLIDYVLNTTHSTQISYIGHAQGVTMLLILCAKMPEYNAKIKIGLGISASASLEHSKFIVIQVEGALDPVLTQSGDLLHKEMFPRGGLIQNSVKLICSVSKLSYPLCSLVFFALLGYNSFQVTRDVLPVVVGHTPSGISLKNFIRWGQLKNNGFTEYDYGDVKNLEVYGRIKPPLFDLSKVTMRWVIIASLNDYVADITDVKNLVSDLPNASLCILSDRTFAHLDFVYGKDIPNYITPIVLSAIGNGTYVCK